MKTCDQWGIVALVSQHQIILIDKTISPAIRNEQTLLQGRIITLTFQTGPQEYAIIFSVYGLPHSGTTTTAQQTQSQKENLCLVHTNLQATLTQAILRLSQNYTNHLPYVHGDLQDTPSDSADFHIGECRMKKDPNGIVTTCENLLSIICMYTSPEGMEKVTDFTIQHDTGFYTDHNLIVINKNEL
jgi:hypothetical protein